MRKVCVYVVEDVRFYFVGSDASEFLLPDEDGYVQKLLKNNLLVCKRTFVYKKKSYKIKQN